MIRQLICIPLFLTSLSVSVFAAAPDFYTINEQPIPLAILNQASEKIEINPLTNFEALTEDLAAKTVSMVSLLNWDHHNTMLEDPAEPYNRLHHFGTWVVNHTHSNCLNTRAEVLIRQSRGPVTFTNGGCRVVTGRWLDPYTGQTLTQASDLDIDHVVPLKNSYSSGSWKWAPQKRCVYANFMANNFHLLAVNSSDNRVKGQNGPDIYMPENKAFTCDYLQIWLGIKLIWNLALPPNEAGAITQLLKQNHCNLAKMALPTQDLQGQRNYISSQREICASSL